MFATVCTVLAVAGHLAAGRAGAAPRAIVAGFAVIYVLAWVLTGTERSLATIVGGLLGGQFMLHALFAATAPTVKVISAHAVHTAPSTGAGGGGGGIGTGGGGLTMTLAHIAAALAAAWWLRRGERAAWTLARRTAALAAHPLRALRPPASPVDAVALDTPLAQPGPYDTAPLIRPTSVLPCGPVTRRGPPFGSMAFICR